MRGKMLRVHSPILNSGCPKQDALRKLNIVQSNLSLKGNVSSETAGGVLPVLLCMISV